MLSQSIAVVTIAACSLGACRRGSTPRADVGRSDAVVVDPDTSLLATYQGDGWRLAVPTDADTGRGNPAVWDFAGTEIRGPLVLSSSGDTGNAYILLATTFPNPGGVQLESWIDSLRATRNVHIMDDSLNFLYPPDTVAVNGQRALRLRPFCGDCQPYEYYFAKGERIVLVKYIDGGLEAWSREKASHMAERIIATFRWNQ